MNSGLRELDREVTLTGSDVDRALDRLGPDDGSHRFPPGLRAAASRRGVPGQRPNRLVEPIREDVDPKAKPIQDVVEPFTDPRAQEEALEREATVGACVSASPLLSVRCHFS
jgi:hypothetical protein